MSWKYCKVHGNYQSFDGTRGCPECLQDVEDAKAHRERMSEEAAAQAADQAERDAEERRENAERLERMREEAAEQAAQDREERREAAEEAEFKRANPGDYECPNCGYITMKRGKSRCPKCQGSVGPEFWPAIYEAERLAQERYEAESRRKAEEWERGRPERERRAEEARKLGEQMRVENERLVAEAQRKVLAEKRFKSLGMWMWPVSWVVGGYIGWVIAHLIFEDPSVKVLLGVPAAMGGAIVGQSIVLTIFKIDA